MRASRLAPATPLTEFWPPDFAPTAVYRYKVIFKPTTIIPDVDLSVP